MPAENRLADARPEWPEDVRRWYDDRCEANRCTITRVALDSLRGWGFADTSGNMAHESGKFFSIEGLDVRTNDGPVRQWQQPIIRQPEIGILGILVKRAGGRTWCLMQAKMEPGNVNGVQLSPTVQATKSNYTRIHGGETTRYLDYFVGPGRGHVVVDVLQSEQGAWFLGKRNRNMVVDVGDDDPPWHEDYRWIALDDLNRLLPVDNLINMDARTVLSCLTVVEQPGDVDGDDFDAAVARSFSHPARHDNLEVLSWFTERKSFYEVTVRRMALAELEHWKCTGNAITHDEGRHFGFIGVEVNASNREVSGWCQPMLMPTGQGVVAFVARQFDGVLHVLVQALVQPGLADVVEMGPTVQCRPQNYAHLAADKKPLFLDVVLSASPDRLRYDSVLSEEGGRFYHAENRYMVVEAGDDVCDDPPPGFHWMTPGQMAGLLRHSHYINVEARTLLACLGSLCHARR